MKKSQEFLVSNAIPSNHPDVVAISKLVEKHPHYEYFFLKAHFGSEKISLEQIESNFKIIQERNIKITKSVDLFVKYIVDRSFTQEWREDNKGKAPTHRAFSAGQNITDVYNLIYKENRKFIDHRTDFEGFADEIRDALTQQTANRIIQQLQASGKKIIETLPEEEKKNLYFNLNSLYETNIFYQVARPFMIKNRTYAIGNQFSESEYLALPAEYRNVGLSYMPLSFDKPNQVQSNGYFTKGTKKPLEAFIKKSARYKTKEALFSDLNAALYSLSGDEEYKKIIETIEDTVGATLEGLNPKLGIIVASALNAKSYSKIGGQHTAHCIRGNESTFSSYQRFGGKQYLVINTKLSPTEDQRFIGLTIDGNGKITAAHTKSDRGISSEVESILKNWGVRQYVKPMNDDEIIEMLYVVINDESIFSNEERSKMVLKFLSKLDLARFDKKKLLQLLRYAKDKKEMKEIIQLSLERKTSEEFLESYNYLSHTILKVVNEEKQAHDIVLQYVNDFNESVGLTKDDCKKMLLNESKYVQPNRLIDIIGKGKFVEYVKLYTFDDLKEILQSLPQLFIYFLPNRKVDSTELKLILKAMYAYEKRPDIRKLVLQKMNENGILGKMITMQDLMSLDLLKSMKEDIPEIINRMK